MSALALLQAFAALQAALAAGALGFALAGGAPEARVRWGRLALLWCLILPVLVAALPQVAPWQPPVHVWAETRDAAPTATLTLPGDASPALAVPAQPALNLGLVVVAALATAGLVGLGRLVWGARALLGPAARWRRLRGVEIWVSPAVTAPCTLWMGRPIIVLDPDSFADPTARLVAVRHELQHQRAGDAGWAWVHAGAAVLSVGNPLASWWRRQQMEAEELACDAALLRRGLDPRTYAETLYAAALRARPLLFPGLVSPARPSLLKRRVEMILRPKPSSRRARLAPALAIPLCLAAALLGQRAVADRRVGLDEVRLAAAELQSPLPVVANEQVRAALEQVSGTPGGLVWARRALEGYAEIGSGVEARLVEAGLPRELSAVIFVESGYRNLTGAELSPSIPERFRGAGYWMFIAETARTYGLRVDETVDERLDLEKETGAAIALLRDDHALYGDWGLALAAYNQGRKKVDAAIAAGGTRDVWELQRRGLLNDYVAQVMAAVLVLEDPRWVE